MAISPWDMSATLPSPDGRWAAEIAEAFEVGMSAPTSGTLRIGDALTLENCNPSMVWSEDGAQLAVPRWTRSRKQQLVVVEPASGQVWTHTEEFRVLELESFEGGVIVGIDSPIHEPRALRVPLADVLSTG